MTTNAQQVPESQRFTLPDGATLAYDVFGAEHLSKGKVPLVMFVGGGCLRSDWGPLFPSIYTKRPGKSWVGCMVGLVCVNERQFWCLTIGGLARTDKGGESRCANVGLHRGIGDSTYSTPERNDQITMEIMARDAVALIEHIGWENVDILGFSMGGTKVPSRRHS